MMKIIATLIAFILAPLCMAQDSTPNAFYQDNVVVVFDASGSMGWEFKGGGTGEDRITVARRSLKAVLQQVPPTTNVGILVFGGQRGWIYELGPADPQKLAEAVDRISTGGGTPLGSYIKQGCDMLLSQRDQQNNNGNYKLLIVTDGDADDGRETRMMNEYAPMVKQRGIVLDVIALDFEGGKRHALSQHASIYRPANDPNAMTQQLQEAFAEVGGTDTVAFEEAIEEIAFLDSDRALALIQGFANPPNQPLGQNVVPTNARRQVNGSSAQQSQSQQTQGTAPVGAIFGIGAIVVVVIIVIVILSAMRY